MQIHWSLFALLSLLLVAVEIVQARRVIRAAPGIEKTGDFIVVLEDNTTHSGFETVVDEILKESPDSVIHEKIEGHFAKIISANISVSTAYKLKSKLVQQVQFIEEETFAHGMSWAIESISSSTNFSPCATGAGVDIYILDSGINYGHCEFGGRAKYVGYDAVDNYDRPQNRQYGRDCNGHGTHVASLAGGLNHGVARNASIYSVRVLRCNNGAPWSVVIDGLEKAALNITQNHRPAIISMSLGGSFSYSTDVAVRNIIKKNITIIAAAGNEETDACSKTPASSTGVITVAGSAENNHMYYFSNGGPCVDIIAPGHNVYAASSSCTACNCVVSKSGTSMATPIVAGAAAMLLEKNPSLTPADIKDRLIKNSIKGTLNFANLHSNLRSSTANRLLYIPQCDDKCFINRTTTTVTSSLISTVRDTTTSTLISTTTRLSTTTVSLTSLLATTTTVSVTNDRTVTRFVNHTSTVTLTDIIPHTVTITSTAKPTPTGVCCETLRNFESLEKNMMNNISAILNNGIQHIVDLMTTNTLRSPLPSPSSSPFPLFFHSCKDLTSYPSLKSGYYNIQTTNGVQRVYCDLNIDIKNHTGFMNVANINMSVPGTECPTGLLLRQDGDLKTCQRDDRPGCSSVFFNSSGVEYTKVCGRVRGYQWASPNAFYWYLHSRGPKTIDGVYVDGVVLTYRNETTGSREHIWTFAGAIDDLGRTYNFNCQCTNNDVTIANFETPPFVGEDYFCETGSHGVAFKYNTLYTDDPLWDGDGCGDKDSCCERGEWFCKDVPKTSSDIELRLCGNEYRSNEDTPLEIIELYIQ